MDLRVKTDVSLNLVLTTDQLWLVGGVTGDDHSAKVKRVKPRLNRIILNLLSL